MTMITRLEVEKEDADIDLPDLGYFYLVWDYVLKYYKTQSRKQDGFDKVVNMTEKVTGYFWPYKPEVSFSIPTDSSTPVPHLTRDRKASKKESHEYKDYVHGLGEKIGLLDPTTEGKNRRHTRWKGSKPIITGAAVKRPDLIIVNNHKIRWPGRGAFYPITNEYYEDNLKQLVEMKYGSDNLSEIQENTYKKIATPERFAVLKIWQDEDDSNKKYIYEFSPDFVPVFGFSKDELLPKIRLEPWMTSPTGRPVDIFSGEIIDRKALESSYHPNTVDLLIKHSPWLEQLGEFERTNSGIRWVSEEDGRAVEFSDKELQEAAAYLEQYGDIPVDDLPYVTEQEVVMSGEGVLTLALKFVKDHKEEIALVVLATGAVIVTAIYFPAIMAAVAGAVLFLLRLARFAPALLATTGVLSAQAAEQFSDRSNCYRYEYLVKKQKGADYEPHEYKILHHLPWEACKDNPDTSHLKGWDEKVEEFEKQNRK